MAKDPVCGMTVKPEKAAAIREYRGETIYFCNPNCKVKFDEAPERYVPDKSNETVALPVEGMSCAKCAAKIDNAMRETEGVIDCAVDHVTKKAKTTFAPASAERGILVSVIEERGYTVPPKGLHHPHPTPIPQEDTELPPGRGAGEITTAVVAASGKTSEVIKCT
ncbi:MAG: YHS domain-containing protein [bacterium]|nr:YHS domain-containing protein [bacterium]